MIFSIFKVIAIGMIGGLALFLVPFLLFHVAVFFLFAGLIFRLFGWRKRNRWMRYHYYHNNFQGFHPHGAKEGLKDHFHQGPRPI